MVKTSVRFFSIPYVRFAGVLVVGTLLAMAAVHLSCLEKKYVISLAPEMIIKSTYGELKLEKNDLQSEPGEFSKYADFNNFFSRQDILAKIIDADAITVTNGKAAVEFKSATKSIRDLSSMFWIQVAVALGGIFISGWIWSLKPKNLGTFFFFLSGWGMGLSALTSAVYTTRLIAIPSALFKSLETVNAWGAAVFGMAMISLFLIYPRVLRASKKLIIFQFVFFIVWTFLYSMQWAPEFANISLIIVTMMLMICIAIGAQFVTTKKDPKSRAILLWLGLSVLLGAGIFVVFNTVPLVLGTAPLEQGYAFLSFLIIYLGLAFGLKQFRLFEVGDWAYRFLFYAVGTAIFVAFDATLVFAIGMDRFPALGLALVIVGFCYLPLRDYFWRFFNRRKELPAHELLGEALKVALVPSPSLRLQRWEVLVRKLFDPLEMNYCTSDSKQVLLESDGVSLILPSVADIPALRIAYPWSGRSLFNLQAVETARQVVTFIAEAETSRQAYDRGVNEERLRIAQDLHDDVGARLLTGLHGESSDLRSTIQGAMSDIRSIVKGIAGEKVLLSDLLADLRSESQKRLQTVAIELVWDIPDDKSYQCYLDYRLHKTLGSVAREIVSNTIKHSNAKKLEIKISVKQDDIELLAIDNGQGFPEKVFNGQTGFGLKGLSKRITDLGGVFEFKNAPHALIFMKIPKLN